MTVKLATYVEFHFSTLVSVLAYDHELPGYLVGNPEERFSLDVALMEMQHCLNAQS